MGNFRFGSASNMQPGIPYFPVACCGPDQHKTFAIGTEADALLHQAFATAAAAYQQQQQQQKGILQLAKQELQEVLTQHFAPLEAAALQIQAAFAAQCNSTAAAAAAADAASIPPQQQNSSSSNAAGVNPGFTYLGLDTSLAPGLDTPPLTDSYELLLQQLLPPTIASASAATAEAGASKAAVSGSSPAAAAGVSFGCPGSLTISSMITQVLKTLPLKLTGYCGLMLAVCEDQVGQGATTAHHRHFHCNKSYAQKTRCGAFVNPGSATTMLLLLLLLLLFCCCGW
jgi:hypothetical protein